MWTHPASARCEVTAQIAGVRVYVVALGRRPTFARAPAVKHKPAKPSPGQWPNPGSHSGLAPCLNPLFNTSNLLVTRTQVCSVCERRRNGRISRERVLRLRACQHIARHELRGIPNMGDQWETGFAH